MNPETSLEADVAKCGAGDVCASARDRLTAECLRLEAEKAKAA